MQDEEFKIVLWRKDQPTDQPTGQVKKLILVLNEAMARQEIMDILDLKHNPTFRENYLNPALQEKWIEMTIPGKANDPNQKYRLTAKGKALQQQLKKKK
jgi:hypothetical protein